MKSSVKKIVIVGGGTAGWITASYLNGALNDRGNKPEFLITLIESPDVPRISVGEATVPSIHHVLEVVGVNEIDFMKATDATFKQSIKYVDWLYGEGEAYHHPFSRFTPGPIDRSGSRWMASLRDIPFMETVSAQAVIADIVRAPKTMDGRPFQTPLKYAYHFDAQLFADYLQEFSVGRGVEHILANVTTPNMSDDGYIESVNLEDGRSIEGELFIDCTGFKGLLISETMGVPWEDFSQWLFCNRAVVTQFEYEDHFPGIIRPYTTATAQSAGWIWDTPTQTRRATGYVYASDFISDEKAEEELLAYQGNGAKSATRVIHFRTGQRQKVWTKNCIAIGLAGGFIEPLESTGIYLSELGAVLLAEHFPHDKAALQAMAFRYNRIMSNRYYEVLDFINLHYCLTRRQDTEFWKVVQQPEHITDRLKAKLELWRQKSPSLSDFDDQSFAGFDYAMRPGNDPEIDPRPPTDAAGLWNHASYESILFGMDFRGPEFAENFGADRPNSRVPQFVINAVRAAPKLLPPHHVWLHKHLGMNAWPKGTIPEAWLKHQA